MELRSRTLTITDGERSLYEPDEGSAGEVRHVLHIHQVVNREFIPHLHQVIPNLCSPPEPLPQIPPSEFVHFEKLKRSQKINAGGQLVPASRAAVLELSDLTLP